MKHRVGSVLIHPFHGASKVKARTKREFDGEQIMYLEMEVLNDTPQISNRMRLFVIEDSVEKIGLRPPATKEEAEEIVAILKETENVRMPTNWSRRYKNHTEMLKTGDKYMVATVVRNLRLRGATAKLSAAERTMQNKAERFLASELAVTWGVTSSQALELIHKHMDSAGEPEKKTR